MWMDSGMGITLDVHLFEAELSVPRVVEPSLGSVVGAAGGGGDQPGALSPGLVSLGRSAGSVGQPVPQSLGHVEVVANGEPDTPGVLPRVERLVGRPAAE